MSNKYGFTLNCGRRIAVLKTPKKSDYQTVYLYNPKFVCSSDCKETKACKCSDGKCETKEYHDSFNGEIYQTLEAPKNTKFMISSTNQKHQTNNVYITGPPGCGKSDFVVQYLKIFQQQHKGIPTILISEGAKDDRLDPYITKRIMPQEIINENLNFDDFQDLSSQYGGLIIVFDDIDSLPSDNKNNLKKRTYDLMNSIINNSRKYNISVIFTSHTCLEGKYTGTMIRACSQWVFFTEHMNTNTENCAKIYFDLNPKQFSKLKTLLEESNSHWCSVVNSTPKVIVSEHNIFKLSDL